MTDETLHELKQKWIGSSKPELDTPCLVLDRPALEYNIRTMQAAASRAHKQVRPHIKTHKCSVLAKLQLEAGAVGVCAAKASEAEGLIAAGIRGVLITSPVVAPQKIERLLSCAGIDSQLMVVIDALENARALDAAARRAGLKLKVLVDVDPGLNRTGVKYDDALPLGRAVARLENLELAGVQCYAGNLQHVPDFSERRAASQAAMRRAGQIVLALRDVGLSCPILTGAGTGTYDVDFRVEEVTEVQVGSYAVMDAEYASIGSAEDAKRFERFRFSLTLLTTVISANHPTHVTVDAGLKALYRDPTKPEILRPTGLEYDWFGDEHGKITSVTGILPQLGDVLELAVSHCDPTINLFDYFFITEGPVVVDIWPIDLRGRSQ